MGCEAPDEHVKGLQICRKFLNRPEATALRHIFNVHLLSDWSPYEYGEKMVGSGGGEKLSSTLQRIDYGDARSTQDMVAEGRTGDLGRRSVKRLDRSHRAILELVSSRMRTLFKDAVPEGQQGYEDAWRLAQQIAYGPVAEEVEEKVDDDKMVEANEPSAEQQRQERRQRRQQQQQQLEMKTSK